MVADVRRFMGSFPAVCQEDIKRWSKPGEDKWLSYIFRFMRGGPSQPSSKLPLCPAFLCRMTRALMDSLGPEWRLKLPSIPLVPVSAQKRWNSLPPENHKETAKSKSKETTAVKGRGKP